MSVYTTVERDELAAWLRPLSCGDLIDHAGIAAGMQNSNYFVTTTQGRYVLTLFETLPTADLDFYLQLQGWLAGRGLPCPDPLSAGDGRRWRPLCGKPAALLSCLQGVSVERPGPAHCIAVGAALARLHKAAAGLAGAPANPCGAAWRRATGDALLPLLTPDDAVLLADELAYQVAQDWSALPSGVIHADLFRDNVLWDERGRLSGLLDFYFAGVDAWIYDLAVVANDWSADQEGLAALVAGYESVRPLLPAERAAWLAVRRAAALRFWLLRLDAVYRPRAGSVVTVKNPDAFRRLLMQFRLAPMPLPG
ncbi:homoserine kinase [Azonexus sp. R2A61]|uniref:homoserine kinase n=1 Tax=Azonexus sp. R2A61 TaxID=2744443 RepID=UPI001F1B9147|nr:homoserine kinase [Azonexus sp. R2A61]